MPQLKSASEMPLTPGVPCDLISDGVRVRRILGLNPSPMTGPGTNSYLIGDRRMAIVDPGPADDTQFENFMAAIGEASLEWIFVTHTHGDHSPGAARLKSETGARLIGLPAPDSGSHDRSFRPDGEWQHGDVVDCGEFSIELIHTPGHVSNHFCYLIRELGLLFTGDHVLQGTTSVILPPDGDMTAYMDSLAELQTRGLNYLAPGHGLIMDDPSAEIEKLRRHRLQREHKIYSRLEALGRADIDTLVVSAYDDVAPHLIPWAKKTMLAHLIKLEREGRIKQQEEDSLTFWSC